MKNNIAKFEKYIKREYDNLTRWQKIKLKTKLKYYKLKSKLTWKNLGKGMKNLVKGIGFCFLIIGEFFTGFLVRRIKSSGSRSAYFFLLTIMYSILAGTFIMIPGLGTIFIFGAIGSGISTLYQMCLSNRNLERENFIDID